MRLLRHLLPVLLLVLPPGARAQGRDAVVVELFTSEGCSSCPPADLLLMSLERTAPVPGVELIALEEHVDVWNQLGWADPFSSAAFTARQGAYAERFGLASVYTPQAVIDGASQLVGTREGALVEEIRKAASRPGAHVALALHGAALHVRVDALPAGSDAASEVMLLWTESGLATDVPRGENAGAHLRHASVVRRLQPLGTLSAGSFEQEVPLAAPRAIAHPENARLVVLVQERASRRILGAAAIKASSLGR